MEKINHPEHYKGNKYEAIDIIDDYQLGFNLGNAVKYILRAGKKGDAAEDLKKAKWYIEHEICKLMNEQERKKEKEQVDAADVFFAKMYAASKAQKKEAQSKRCPECKRYGTKDCTMTYWVCQGTDISNYTCSMWEAKK